MNLAVVVGRFPSLSETFILRELRALRALGFKVTVYALAGPPPEEAVLAPAAEFPTEYPPSAAEAIRASRGVASLRADLAVLPGFGALTGERLLGVRHLLTAVVWAEDMSRRGIQWVHGHFAYVPSLVALLCAGTYGTPFSFSAHAWDLWCTHDDLLLRTLVERARFVAVCTDYGRNFLLGRIGRRFSRKVRLLYHGIDVSAYPFRLPATGDEPRLVAVGRLVPKKGFDVLVDTCGRLRNDHGIERFSCTIIGGGPQLESLQRQAAEKNMTDAVFLPGAMPHSQVKERLARAHVCIVPSVVAADGDRDGLPNVILEAAALGTPLVVTDCSGLPEFVEDGVTGLVVPSEDAEALARAVHAALTNPERTAVRSVAARRKVERQFDALTNATTLARLFEGES